MVLRTKPGWRRFANLTTNNHEIIYIVIIVTVIAIIHEHRGDANTLACVMYV